MMQTSTYIARRGELETYFDRTAVDAWRKLTSDAPVGRIRATVRAGRDRMRATLLSWLPEDLRGRRVLDAGCGTGALAVEAALRGAEVVAIDLSPTLVDLARERLPKDLGPGSITFLSGDMLDPKLGMFDHIVGMDSLIHYRDRDMVGIVEGFAKRARQSVIFTFAPSTAALEAMHMVGRLFPRGNRAPAIEPIRHGRLRQMLSETGAHHGWRIGRSQRINSGFYLSQALEVMVG